MPEHALKLSGVFVALTTPFDFEGQIYRAKVEHNVGKLNDLALGGYLVCGSTGETPMLSYEERAELLELVKNTAAPGRLLIAGCGSESVRESVQLSQLAAERGYNAVLAVPPFYYRDLGADPANTLLYFRALADRSPLPVLLYNIPQVTGFALQSDWIAALAEHPNIAGMKDSSGNLTALGETLRALGGKQFPILSGAATNFQTAIEMGAAGAMLALANAIPYACVTVWEAMRIRQHEAAADWQARIQPIQHATRRYGIPGLKYAMDLNGFYGGPPRLPYTPVGPGAKAEIEAAQATMRD